MVGILKTCFYKDISSLTLWWLNCSLMLLINYKTRDFKRNKPDPLKYILKTFIFGLIMKLNNSNSFQDLRFDVFL